MAGQYTAKSFNAKGSTVTAFETIDEGPRAFGVKVHSNDHCGVYGESMKKPPPVGIREAATPFTYRFFGAVKPQFAPVHGRGVSALVSAPADARRTPRAVCLRAVMVSGQASARNLPHGKISALNSAATKLRRPRTTQLKRRCGG